MSHIALGVMRVSKTYPKGGLVGNLYVDSKTRKSKTISLTIMNAELAYETVDLWAEDVAKETGYEYKKVTLKELLIRMDSAWTKPSPTNQDNTAKSNLGNIKFFKMEMRRAFKFYNIDKIREVLKEGTKLLGELQREKLKIERNSGKAKLAVAQAMYHTWVETSVDTSIYCTDENIVAEFKRLQEVNKPGKLI